MRDASNYSCRKFTGVRLFPSKKITFHGFHNSSLLKQTTCSKKGRENKVDLEYNFDSWE